jgi:integrase
VFWLLQGEWDWCAEKFEGLPLGGYRFERTASAKTSTSSARSWPWFDRSRANQGSVELRPPKCGSERTVFLAPELDELLASHIACNGVEPEPTSWIFRGGREDPPHQNTIGHRWRRTLKRAGVSGVRLHDLRHYFASGLIAAGCDVVTVQRALGHARATTTLDTYSHLWPSAEDRGRDAAASLMLESAGQYRATGTTASL